MEEKKEFLMPFAGKLAGFYSHSFLSDITLISPKTNQEIKYYLCKKTNRAHKIVLAAGSKYFHELFQQSKEDKLTVPRNLETGFDQSKDPLLVVLKYLYENQVN